MTATMTLRDKISGRMTGSSLFPFFWEGSPELTRRPEPDIALVSVSLMSLIFPLEPARSTFQASWVTPSRWENHFVPKTELGKRLLDLRNRAIASGIRLLSEDEVLEEVRRRRGEIEDNEKDLY